jgi:membrane-associated phospholipid phosphatase
LHTILASAKHRVSLALLALAAVSGLIAFRLVGAHWGRGVRFDLSAIQDGNTQLEAPGAQRATKLLLDTISVGSLAVVGAAFVTFALARRRRDLAAACLLVLVAAPLTTELLKRTLKPRPNVPSQLDGSFPSGHATIALAIGLALILVVPPAMRVAAAVAGIAYAIAVGTALVVTGSHFPSDVGGGFCVATGWAAVAALFAGRPLEMRLQLRLLAGLLLLAAVAVTVVLITHPGALVRVRLHLRLAESVFGIAAVATVLCAAFIAAIAVRSSGRPALDRVP